ncbi:tRNA (adenosine(37)-N6)-threonylcarbamoyltransferase complex ATPase subunit type 1 TsaE [bacterium TMED277]|nr:MAG: tRNA (adenosine(37)-N6)-threonylcarbamoyltransferase complex ATPase subunit type 1 TsaE [bacterium TMED277]|tara:strand:- start:2454 stop:2954 length:501 start_codon:yes stop_codon:yes gene_type:complete
MSKKKGILHGNALSKTEILDLAEIFAKNIEKGDIILVEGPIGIGKTFFSRAIINARCLIDKLEIEEVPSPTFSIIQEYDLKYFSILHLDLYRLEIETDLLELGVPDIFDENVMIIEWPDLIKNFLPSRFLSVSLFQNNTDINSRNIKLKFVGEGWENICKSLIRMF